MIKVSIKDLLLSKSNKWLVQPKMVIFLLLFSSVSPKSVISVSKPVPSATTTNDENDVVYVDRDYSSTKKPTTDKQSDSAEYYYYYEDGQPASTKPSRSTVVTTTTTTAKTSTIIPTGRATFSSVPKTGSTTITAAGTPKTLTTIKPPQTSSRQQTSIYFNEVLKLVLN